MKYSVFSAFPLWEISGTRYDSIDHGDLDIFNEAGRRSGMLQYGINLATYQDDVRHTFLQSINNVFAMTTFTTFFWFKPDVTLNNCILLQREGIWAIRVINGHIAFELDNRSILGPIVTQGDHFVAVSFDNNTGNAELYYDGNIVSTGYTNDIMPVSNIPITYSSPVFPFNGYLTTALWTNLVLTEAQLDDIYNNADGRLVSWYFEIGNIVSIKVLKRDKITILEHGVIRILEKDTIPCLEVFDGRR